MPTNADYFEFDVNYASTNVGVFTKVDLAAGGGILPPPPANVLLLTDGSPILLTTGTSLNLA